jgi:alpha-N-arabinofuranosidase
MRLNPREDNEMKNHKKPIMNINRWLTRYLVPTIAPVSIAILSATTAAFAQTNLPVIQVHADKVTAKTPPTFYGLMTEEINFAFEGGLYGELIRNRAFKSDSLPQAIKPDNYDTAKFYPAEYPANVVPKFWKGIGAVSLSLDTNTPLNDALNVSLRMEAAAASATSPAGIANGGYWGIPVEPQTAYKVSFFAKAAAGFRGLVAASIESADGKTVFASAEISGINGDWQKFEARLKTKSVEPSKDNVFKITTSVPGTIWLQQVSLFRPTYKNRPNGDREDISQLLTDAKPKFLRFPGGNYVEGNNFNERFNWKQMVGPVEQRPGHRSCWGYWSTDGFGLPEFLGWCQDIGMEPVLAVFAGYTLNHDHVTNGPALEPYVQEALEEIEYVTGDASTKWGAQRIKDGYPNPFPLHYVEIGNEDFFDRSGSYEGRFAQFFDAIRAKYPQLKIISTTAVKSRTADLNDEHYYESEESMERQAFMYDTRDRGNPTKIFVGEWATRVGSPTPNMAGALGDAAWMCCLERNSDIVLMHCFAPLFVNVSQVSGNNRSMQWASDLIGYDALNSYGSPSYYAQKLFSVHQGDEVLATTADNLPTYQWIQTGRRSGGQARTNEVKSVFYSATRDTKRGKIIVKIVNRADTAQSVEINITGVKSVAAKGTATVLKAANRNETNTLQDPEHIVPVTEKIRGLGVNFTRSYPPCSITVLELAAK